MSSSVNRGPVSASKHAAMLRAGREQFLKHGFAHAVVADIARDADVSTATLYKHFRSKEELFAAIVADAARAAVGFESFIRGDASADEVIMNVAEVYLSVQFDNGLNDLLRVLISEAASAPKLAREMFDIVVERRNESFKTVLDELVVRGKLKPHDTRLSVSFAAGIIKELFIWPALFQPDYRPPEDAKRQIQAGIDLLLARYGV